MKQINTTEPIRYRFRGNISGAILLTLVLFGNTALATTEYSEDGHLAIEGYDPVAYFTMLLSVRGQESISHEWLDKIWLFANQEHKRLFIADPMAYLPNYGGFCSIDSVIPEHNLAHDIDPETWRIVDDKLYLFYAEDMAVQNLPALKWKTVKAGLQ